MFKPLSPVALNNSTLVAIQVDANVSEVTFLLQCDAAIDVSLSDTLAGTNVWTLKSGSALAISVTPNVQEGKFTLCYAKSASATPNLQILQVL